MGAKRKAAGASAHTSSKAPEVDYRAGRTKRIERWDDGLDDEDGEDGFERNQDKLFLEEAADANEDDLAYGDEVMRLNVPDDQSEDDDDEEKDSEDEEDEADEDEPIQSKRIGDDDRLISSSRGLSRFDRPDPTAQDTLHDASDSDEDSSTEEEEQGWRGAYHVSQKEEAEVDSEDEEEVENQVNEALRLQRLQRERLDEADFGVDAFDVANGAVDKAVTLPIAPEAARTFESADHAIAYLVQNEPEILALSDDFGVMSHELNASIEALAKSESPAESRLPITIFARLYQHLLLLYLSSVAFLFHLRTRSNRPTNGTDLEHKVLERITQLREAISVLQAEGVGAPTDDFAQFVPSTRYQPEGDDEDGDEEVDLDAGDMTRQELIDLISEWREAQGEAGADLPDNVLNALRGPDDAKKSRGKRKRGAVDPPEEDDLANGTTSQKRKRKKRSKSTASTEEPSPLLQLELPTYKSKLSHADEFMAGAEYLEPSTLSAAEADEKAKKKRDLRFYTAKIDATANRRQAAGRAFDGGDDDIPYRSRERSREAVLERQRRQAATLAAQKDNGSAWDDDDDTPLGELMDPNEAYYDSVIKKKAEAAQEKKAAHDTARLAERDGLMGDADETGNGPRAVNRTIIANRGLTPKRAKANRNPRVKKRLRYDKAQKKVASMKPVFKGGLSKGQTYTGEATGIAKRTVRSTKF